MDPKFEHIDFISKSYLESNRLFLTNKEEKVGLYDIPRNQIVCEFGPIQPPSFENFSVGSLSDLVYAVSTDEQNENIICFDIRQKPDRLSSQL